MLGGAQSWPSLDFTGPVPALRVTGLSEQGRAPISQGRKSGQGSPLSAFGLRGRKSDMLFKVCWGRCLGHEHGN